MCSYLQERSQEHIGSNYTGQGRGGLREARNWLLSGCAAVCICMPHPCAAPHVLPAGHRTTSSGNGWLQPVPWPIGTWMDWATTTLGLHQWAKKKKKRESFGCIPSAHWCGPQPARVQPGAFGWLRVARPFG